MPNYYTTKQFSENLYITKYRYESNLCYTDTDSFILDIKTKDFYEDINNDVEEWFDTSNYKIDKPLLITEKKKKSTW